MELEFWISVARSAGMIAAIFVVVAGAAQPWLQGRIDAKKDEENSRLLKRQQEELQTRVDTLAANAQKERGALEAQVTDLDRKLKPFVDFAIRSHRDLSVDESLSRLHEEIIEARDVPKGVEEQIVADLAAKLSEWHRQNPEIAIEVNLGRAESVQAEAAFETLTRFFSDAGIKIVHGLRIVDLRAPNMAPLQLNGRPELRGNAEDLLSILKRYAAGRTQFSDSANLPEKLIELILVGIPKFNPDGTVLLE
jgi:hypothetical protein